MENKSGQEMEIFYVHVIFVSKMVAIVMQYLEAIRKTRIYFIVILRV